MTTRQTIFLYTDGAASGNPGPGGYGVVLKCGDLRKELSGGFALTTNNRMEMLAVIKGYVRTIVIFLLQCVNIWVCLHVTYQDICMCQRSHTWRVTLGARYISMMHGIVLMSVTNYLHQVRISMWRLVGIIGMWRQCEG